jgi:hypothetical protein
MRKSHVVASLPPPALTAILKSRLSSQLKIASCDLESSTDVRRYGHENFRLGAQSLVVEFRAHLFDNLA